MTDLRFPFEQFPPLKYAVAYGSSFLPPSKAARVLPSLPDYLLVIDESQHDVASWHLENRRRNPKHYASLFRKAIRPEQLAWLQSVRPAAYFSPLAVMGLPSKQGDLSKVTKYMVATSTAVERDLAEWNDFFFAGRLQKPALMIKSDGDHRIEGDCTTFCHEAEGELGKFVGTNALNALRLSLLLSGPHLSLRDLLRTTASLSYLGDSRCRIVDEGIRARGGVNYHLLSFLQLYAPQIPKLRDAWTLVLEEGDDDILKGRYVPEQYGPRTNHSSPDAPAPQLKFDLSFKNPDDEQLVLDILTRTAGPLREHMKLSYALRLAGETRPVPAPKVVMEALKDLNSRQLLLEQSFSSEAHCSIFHRLPGALQTRAGNASARARLNRVFNPFFMLDSARDREILGGPLPWENICVEAALKRLVSRSSRRACLKGLVLAGPTRAGLYSFQKYCGHLTA